MSNNINDEPPVTSSHSEGPGFQDDSTFCDCDNCKNCAEQVLVSSSYHPFNAEANAEAKTFLAEFETMKSNDRKVFMDSILKFTQLRSGPVTFIDEDELSSDDDDHFTSQLNAWGAIKTAYPLSEHCPFSSKSGIRNCCQEHASIDVYTSKHPVYNFIIEYRISNYNQCDITNCEFCSVIKNKITISPQMMRAMASAAISPNAAAMMFDEEPLDSILKARGATHFFRSLLVYDPYYDPIVGDDEGQPEQPQIMGEGNSAATAILQVWRTIHEYSQKFKNFVLSNSTLLTMAAIVLSLWALSKATIDGVSALRILIAASKLLIQCGVSIFSRILKTASVLLSYLSERLIQNPNVSGGSKKSGVKIFPQSGPDKPDGMCAIFATILMMSIPSSRDSMSSIMLAISRSSSLANGLKTAKNGLLWVSTYLPAEIQAFLLLDMKVDLNLTIYEEYKDLLFTANNYNCIYKQDGPSSLKDMNFCVETHKTYAALKTHRAFALAESPRDSINRYLVQRYSRDGNLYW